MNIDKASCVRYKRKKKSALWWMMRKAKGKANKREIKQAYILRLVNEGKRVSAFSFK